MVYSDVLHTSVRRKLMAVERSVDVICDGGCRSRVKGTEMPVPGWYHFDLAFTYAGSDGTAVVQTPKRYDLCSLCWKKYYLRDLRGPYDG
jgi:hypothetical protein